MLSIFLQIIRAGSIFSHQVRFFGAKPTTATLRKTANPQSKEVEGGNMPTKRFERSSRLPQACVQAGTIYLTGQVSKEGDAIEEPAASALASIDRLLKAARRASGWQMEPISRG